MRFKGKGEKWFPWDQTVYCLLLLFSFFIYLVFKHSSAPSLESSLQLAATVEHNSQILQACSRPWALGSFSRFLGTMPTEVTGDHLCRAAAASGAQANEPQEPALQGGCPRPPQPPLLLPCHPLTPFQLVALQPEHCCCTRALGSPTVTRLVNLN